MATTPQSEQCVFPAARNTIGRCRIFTVCLWCMYHRHHNLMIIVRTWTCVSTDQIPRSPHCQAPMIHDKWSLQFTEHVSSQQPDYFTFYLFHWVSAQQTVCGLYVQWVIGQDIGLAGVGGTNLFRGRRVVAPNLPSFQPPVW